MMKKVVWIIFALAVFSAYSCKKDDNSTDQTTGTPFEYRSLSASDTVSKISSFVTLTADASGDGLTYTWIPEFGSVVGSGASVQWAACHSDFFTITCEVADSHGAKESKSVVVHVKP
jgi:hypothetical protein